MHTIVIEAFSKRCFPEKVVQRYSPSNTFYLSNSANALSVLQGVDASLIPTLSFPAFASHEERLVDQTKANVIKRLRGKHGFKRFNRDGYLSQHEDQSRR